MTDDTGRAGLQQAMTSRERMIAAFRNETPDMVPVAPDISNMVPVRLTGRPFWDVYLHGDPPLGQAYVNAVRHYGFDGWADGGQLAWQAPEVEFSRRILEQSDERIVQETTARTPAGGLRKVTVFPADNVPWDTERWVKNVERDLPCIKYLYADPSTWGLAPYETLRGAMGDSGAVGLCVGLPGLHHYTSLFDGGAEAASAAWFENHSALMDLNEHVHHYCVAYARRGLEARPDFLLLGASGLMTLQSPRIFRELSLPAIREITHMARTDGIASHLHACGRQRLLVELLARESELDSIEPLEPPPMGDCDLAEIKLRFGHRLGLKGNLHTTRVMLHGKPDDVRLEALRAMRAAAPGGGFVLATGDQCGRDTPDANLFALVETARRFGRYPLDLESIDEEIRRLQASRSQ